MVGYRDDRYRRFGLASAKLDDALARVTAALVALVRPRPARAVATAVLRDAPAHPSPNAGVAEAAFAAALGLRLGGGANRYGDVVELRPSLGSGRAPGPRDIAATVGLWRDATWLLAALAAAGLAARRHRAAAEAMTMSPRGPAPPSPIVAQLPGGPTAGGSRAARMTTIPPPGPHSGDGARVAAALGLDPNAVLDISASPQPVRTRRAALTAAHLGGLRRYPDLDTAELQLAAASGVPAERLVLTAGGS